MNFGKKLLFPFPEESIRKSYFSSAWDRLPNLITTGSYASAYSIAEAVDGMRLTDFAFDLPGENRSSLALAGIMESMVTGFFDYLSSDVEKLANMTARIVTSAANVKEISTGIQHFKSNVKDMGTVDASALENSFA